MSAQTVSRRRRRSVSCKFAAPASGTGTLRPTPRSRATSVRRRPSPIDLAGACRPQVHVTSALPTLLRHEVFLHTMGQDVLVDAFLAKRPYRNLEIGLVRAPGAPWPSVPPKLCVCEVAMRDGLGAVERARASATTADLSDNPIGRRSRAPLWARLAAAVLTAVTTRSVLGRHVLGLGSSRLCQICTCIGPS